MSAITHSSPPPPLSEDLLAALTRSLQDYAILVLDADGRVASWSVNGGERFKGWDAEEVLGRSHALFYLEEDVAAGRPASELAAAARYDRFEEQHWCARRDGSRYWASIVITAIPGPDGTPRGYGVVIRDTTDQYAAIEALRRSESRFRSVTETAVDAIFAFDVERRIISWNAAAARLYGYTAEQAIGQPVSMLVPEFRREDLAIIVEAAIFGEMENVVIKPVEGVALRNDGHLVPVEVAISSWHSGAQRNFSAIVRDITERKEHERRLQQLADHDPITNLFNRRRFQQELERIVSECGRYDRSAALLVLDLDGFKEVNDLHGHAAGDEILIKVGALLQASVRESDVVGRLGGDEFGVIVQEADRDEAERVAEKVVGAVRSSGMVISDLVRAQVTASVGVALIEPSAKVTAADLQVGADRAMYRAKAEGRCGYAFMVADDDAGAELAARRSWITRLRTSLAQDSFELHAQPIVTLSGGGRPRYELLLRLREGERLLPPAAFLDPAERFDLIGGIDRWVLGQAVRMLHDHQRAGNDISLSVNLSGKTMNDESLARDLARMIEACPIPDGALIVEVTETAAIVNIDRAAALARELRRLGCHFALDDFGSGFSSFHYLKHLEFDYLKIDGEFVANLIANPADQLVVRAVVDIARGLGSRTVAEFVGDDETVALLREIGVDYGQGFHLGRPGPLAQIER